MNPKMNKLSFALAPLLGAGVALGLASAPAGAQQAQKVEKIEVTGSNIKRVEGEGANPIVVITREEIDRTGAQNAYELMNLIASNNSAGNVSIANTIGALTFSAQTASLRGLGGGRTLVLMNGKRLNSFSGEIQGVQGVNLTTIPLAAVERVEILLDGASAIYGSDAIAGVINFIMRKDYRGAEASATYAMPTRGGKGGEQETYKGTIGFGDLNKDRYNLIISAQYDKQKSLEQRARNFSNSSVLLDLGLFGASGTPFPAYVTTGGIGSVGFPNCGISRYVPEIDERCFYDPAQQVGVQMIPDTKTSNLFASGILQLTSTIQAYATGNYMKQTNRFVIQPVPIADVFGDVITLPANSPFYPTAAAIAAGVNGQPLNVRWRAVESGNRDTTDTNEQWQAVAGLKGNWGKWDWDVSGTFNEGTTKQVLNGGFPLRSQLVPLLNTGRVNLFGPNTPAITSEIQATNFIGEVFSGKSKSNLFDGKISGELFNLPAGPVGLAFGAQAGSENLTQTPAPVLATGDLSGFGGNVLSIDRDRDTHALFAEVNIPIVKTLEANLAVRNDHYSDFGSTTNPKVSLRWQPNQDVLLRSSYGRGFLAPSLYQLWTPNISGVSSTGLSDPLRCPTTNDTLDCLTQFGVVFGGNPALNPEKSKQWTLGLVLEPAKGLSLSVDYFNLYLKDTIVNGVSQSTILDDLAQYGGLVTRAPVDPAFPNLPGRILSIDQRYVNLGNQKISGLDVGIQYAFPRSEAGRFKLSVNGTYFIKYDVQQNDGSYQGFVSNVAGSAATGVSPRWKSYQTISWDSGPWNATLGNSYQSSYTDWQVDGNGNERTVSSMTLWDFQVQYRGFKHVILTVGAKNLLDTNPPASNQQNSFQSGFDPSYYDPRARVVYATVGYTFK
jgi:iron complex outermembrane receptor protein